MKLTNKKYYQIDFDKLVLLLLPTFLRKSKLAAFTKVLITPIKEMYNKFRQQQANDWYRLNHNGQVFSLRKVLNDAFDPEYRRIQITDGYDHERTHIYTQLEQKPLYLNGKDEDTKYIYTKEEYNDGVGFLVKIPNDLMSFKPELKALLDKYKLVTTTYEIKNYE